MIDKCSFGSMTIGQQTYTSDLIIYPDGRIVDGWWRATGHRLILTDIDTLLKSKPDIIVAGTGIYGLMRIEKQIKPALASQGIDLVVARTPSAVCEFNRFKQTTKSVAGCFHLTC
jgi:hypothetical protein